MAPIPHMNARHIRETMGYHPPLKPMDTYLDLPFPWLSYLDTPSELSNKGWWPHLTVNHRIIADVHQVGIRYDDLSVLSIRKPPGLRMYSWDQVLNYLKVGQINEIRS